jgi:hypothetical protein
MCWCSWSPQRTSVCTHVCARACVCACACACVYAFTGSTAKAPCLHSLRPYAHMCVRVRVRVCIYVQAELQCTLSPQRMKVRPHLRTCVYAGLRVSAPGLLSVQGFYMRTCYVVTALARWQEHAQHRIWNCVYLHASKYAPKHTHTHTHTHVHTITHTQGSRACRRSSSDGRRWC